MDEWVVYILRSDADGRFYIGSTGDLARRLDYHNRGLSPWTRGKGPWSLVYREQFASRGEAMKREKQIKGWKSRAAIERLIGTTRKD